MQATTTRFRETIIGSHRAVVRLTLLTTIQFGANPTGGTVVSLIDGDVRMNAVADIKATLSCTIPGDYWDAVAPFGVELFAQRGVFYGDGTSEVVPLGFYRVDQASQDDVPYGPIRVDASDRTAQLIQTRVIYPYQVAASTTHRAIVDYLVNGIDSGAGTYGMYGPDGPTVPIVWTDAGYDPDTTTVGADVVVDDSAYDFLAKLVDSKGAVLRFLPTGELAVQARDPDPDEPAVHTIRGGSTGTLVRASRSVKRDGVFNIVRAVGSDPAHQTGHRLAYIVDPLNKLRWNGPFGPAVRYLASPLLTDSDAADAAAETMLARSTGLPNELSLFTVPDPALQPLDKINALVGGVLGTHIIDEVTVPLVGSAPLTIKTRTTNPVGQIETTPPLDPFPEPEDPDTDPGGGGGGPTDPADGTQAAVLRGWGTPIVRDEFNSGSVPDPALWGLYNGPGHSGNGLRRPSAFSVHAGMMTITGNNVSGGTTGGAAFEHSGYGYRVEVRCRTYSTGTGGNAYHPVLILWPDSNDWPAGAEYDFFETDCDSGEFGLFMHLPNHQPYRQDHVSFDLDIENWHNYACEWDPRAKILRAFVDGEMVYEGLGRVAQAPGPMHLTVQLDNFDGNNMRPAKMDIAWVRAYQKPNA